MSSINVSAWGRRRRSFSDPTPEPNKAFSYADYNRLVSTVDMLAYTQLKHMVDDFTADELRELFIPERHREALTHVYSVEEPNKAYGHIYVDLISVLGTPELVFPEAKAHCVPTATVLGVKFDREKMPDGFVTPTPLCGVHNNPIKGLYGKPTPELQAKFCDMMRIMVRVAGEWAAVKWVLGELQSGLRTPQQARYVWPATYTLAAAAKLGIAESLSEASGRAGNNAITPPQLLPYLKPTYEVVARSVLLGINGDDVEAYRGGQLRLVTSNCEVDDGHTIFGC
jgi:hypothetical protein